MKTAAQLLEEFTSLGVDDPERTVGLFCEDGTYEVPYLESLGLPWRYQGHIHLMRHFRRVREIYPLLTFHDVEIVCAADHCVVAEYQFTSRSSQTGRMIHQLVIGRLEAANGQVKLLRESVDLVEFALANHVNGLSDYRIPQDRD